MKAARFWASPGVHYNISRTQQLPAVICCNSYGLTRGRSRGDPFPPAATMSQTCCYSWILCEWTGNPCVRKGGGPWSLLSFFGVESVFLFLTACWLHMLTNSLPSRSLGEGLRSKESHQHDRCYCRGLKPMHRDGFSFFHGRKESSEEAGRRRVELSLDQSFSCLELLTF